MSSANGSRPSSSSAAASWAMRRVGTPRWCRKAAPVAVPSWGRIRGDVHQVDVDESDSTQAQDVDLRRPSEVEGRGDCAAFVSGRRRSPTAVCAQASQQQGGR